MSQCINMYGGGIEFWEGGIAMSNNIGGGKFMHAKAKIMGLSLLKDKFSLHF